MYPIKINKKFNQKTEQIKIIQAKTQKRDNNNKKSTSSNTHIKLTTITIIFLYEEKQ